jgi:nicotinamidase-related amidase
MVEVEPDGSRGAITYAFIVGVDRMSSNVMRAEPYDIEFDRGKSALVIIDMQRDFVEPGGFGESLGNDVSILRKVIPPTKRVLDACRKASIMVVHTREGHRPDLSDCPQSKMERGKPTRKIGDDGTMGRLLVRGEKGHDIVSELYPIPGEVVIDKPGKGAFYATDLELVLRNAGIKTLIVCGVTTEVCVNTTVREGNDRGFNCVVLEDCVGSYFTEFQQAGLAMIKAQGGIFGWVSNSTNALAALA